MMFAKRKHSAPPRTQLGMDRIHAPIFAMTPKTSSQNPHANPALVEAHLVSETMPLF